MSLEFLSPLGAFLLESWGIVIAAFGVLLALLRGVDLVAIEFDFN